MKHTTKRRLSFTLATIAVLLATLSAGIAPSTAAPTGTLGATNSTLNTPGSQWLASCLNSGRTLSVLFVLDVSGSLFGTDPSQFRYEGLRIALTTLANAKPADGSDVTIEASVAGFGNGWYPSNAIVPWQKINIDTPDTLINTMVNRTRDQTAWRNEGTNFGSIFQPAINELTTRGGAESCKAIVWFTDGDDEAGSVPDLCRIGGRIDEMRDHGIVLVGLRLGSTSDPSMGAMALGTHDGQSCGTNPIPEGSAPGIYLSADNVKRLFASIQNIVEGCTVTSGAHVDPGIRRVRVNIYQGVGSIKFDLPGNISFTAGTEGQSGPFDGIHVTSVREDFYVTMELTLPAGVGVGDWLVSSTIPLNPADIEFCVFSDLHLALDDTTASKLPAGSAGILTVNVLDADDEPGDLSVFATATAAASLVGPDGQPRTIEASMNPNGRDIDLLVRTEPSDARLDLTVTLTLITQSGLDLTPLTLETAVVTALNEYYPRVTPLDELDLGTALREDPTSAVIEMVGSSKGPTRVCFDDPTGLSVPPDAANADPVYSTGCISLAADETRSLTVSVSTTTSVEGDGSAEIPMRLHAAPDDAGYEGEAQLNLPVTWRFSSPLDVGVLIWVFLAVLILSILLPVLAILWANWITARYDVTSVQWERIDVIIDGRDVRRRDPLKGGSDAIVGNVRDAGIRGKRSIFFGQRRFARRFELDGVNFLSKVFLNPMRPPMFWAESPNGTLLFTTFGSATGPSGEANTASVAPAFDGAMLLIVRPEDITTDAPVRATAIALVSNARYGSDATTAARRAGWPGRLAALRSAPIRDGEQEGPLHTRSRPGARPISMTSNGKPRRRPRPRD